MLRLTSAQWGVFADLEGFTRLAMRMYGRTVACGAVMALWGTLCRVGVHHCTRLRGSWNLEELPCSVGAGGTTTCTIVKCS